MAAPQKLVGRAELLSGNSCFAVRRRTCSRGASLIELLVVFFIISIMLALMLPALQSARARVDVNVCQNNVRQLGMALSRYIDSQKRFPQPKQWTIVVLKYIEEDALADTLAHGVPKNANLERPKIMRCPAQSEVSTTVGSVPMCHYILVVDRPAPSWDVRKIPWEMHDVQDLSREKDDGSFDPWYFGPEITFVQQNMLFATKQGPHPNGLYYDSNGQTRGGGQ